MNDEYQMHDTLKQLAKELVEDCCERWSHDERLKPQGFTWPCADAHTAEGVSLKDTICTCDLPEDATNYAKIMSNLVIRTGAVAMLFYYQLPDRITAHFETTVGAARWELPIEEVTPGRWELSGIVEKRTDGLILFRERRGSA